MRDDLRGRMNKRPLIHLESAVLFYVYRLAAAVGLS